MSQDSAESDVISEKPTSILTRTWRYFPFKRYDPYMKIALNEVALASVNQSGTPIVWICGWDKNTVNVGLQQNINEVVNLKVAKQMDLTIVRRQIPGGALYLDRGGEISWAIIMPNELLPKDQSAIEHIYAEKLITALSTLGIESYFKPQNDIMTTLGKISHIEVRQERNATYISGTLIYAVDLSIVKEVLQPENDSTRQKRKSERYKPLTAISLETEKSRDETITALTESFLNKVTFKVDDWSNQEMTDAQTLAEKYSGEGWLRYKK